MPDQQQKTVNDNDRQAHMATVRYDMSVFRCAAHGA